MIDPNGAMISWLQSNPALTALVDPGNFMAPVLAEGFSALADTSPSPMTCAVVVRRIGGLRPSEVMGVIEPILAVEAWSSESTIAAQIMGIISDMLHGSNSVDLGTAGYVIACQEALSPQDLVDPETHWSVCFAHYRVMMRSGSGENVNSQFQIVSPSPNFADDETPSPTGNPVVFTLLHAPNPVASLELFMNGLELDVVDDFNIDGNQITFMTAPPAGADLRAWYRY